MDNPKISKNISLSLDLFENLVKISELKGWSLSKTYQVVLRWGLYRFLSDMEQSAGENIQASVNDVLNREIEDDGL